MKNIKSIEEFLFESKSSAKKRFLDRGLVSVEVFDRFLEVDITPTKKFIEKMCEFFVAGEVITDIVNTFEKTISLSNRQILNFDISLIKSLSELQSLISEKETYQTRSERISFAREGAEVTYEDSRFKILYITTKEASCYYGVRDKWCISYTKSNEKNKWDSYYNVYNSRFYFILDNNPEIDEWGKLAVEFKEDGDIVVWDSDDQDDSGDMDIFYILEEYGLPISIFKYHKDLLEELDLQSIKFKKQYGIVGSYKINSNGEVDVDGDVHLKINNIHKIPVKFGEVTGDFICTFGDLTTLENCPHTVGGNFSCYSNRNLYSLRYAPKYVGGDIDATFCNLKTLQGFPTYVGRDIKIQYNLLTKLESGYLQRECFANFMCHSNLLTSLEGIPERVKGSVLVNGQQNGHQFTEEYVREICEVDGDVEV